MRKRNLAFVAFVLVCQFYLAQSALAGFTPPSNVPYTAAAYADRAKLKNSTGGTALAAYASPASCPLKVNLFSQNTSYSLPLLNLLGRAGLNLNLALTYNSKVWIKSGSTIYFDGDNGWPAPGWRMHFGRMDGVYSGPDGYNHYYFISSDGNVHDLRFNSSSGLYESTDSTFMDFNDASGVLRLKDGTQIAFAQMGSAGAYVLAYQIKDRNGNYITIHHNGQQNIDHIVDTLGRSVNFAYNLDNTLASISATGFGGAARTWSFAYTNVTLNYSFVSSLTVNGPSYGSQVKVLSSVTYPNGTQVTFQYNGYAQLTEADFLSNSSTLRGKHLITWQNAPVGGWSDSPTPSQVGNYDGTSTNNWSLTFNSYSTTVTDPTSVPQTTTFIQSGLWDDGLPSQPQVASPVLRTFANTWGNDGNLINPRLTTVTSTLNDTGQQSQVQTTYTTYGNPSEVKEYDFGLTLVRRTTTSYVTDSNYTSRHILNLVSSTILYDGLGAAKSRTDLTYDGATLVSATGASQHDDISYGTGFVYRGLVTLVTQYTSPAGPSGSITHSKTFDMLGNLRTEMADCCVQKQYNFSLTTQFSQPDSIVRGSGTTLTISATYDGSTSLLASSTDENNQTSSYSYDVMDRQTSFTRPDGVVISTSFDDAAANPASTVTTPITASTSVKRTTTLDGLGRAIRATVTDAGGTVYSKVDTQYDALGRAIKTSNPYTGLSASYWTQRQYDSINRVTKVIPPDGSVTAHYISFSYSGNTVTLTDQVGKQRKRTTDAPGRLVQVTEPDPANGNLLTLLTTYTSDPMNNLTQIAQGVQTRTFVFDGLSRKTSETTPEAGTVNYVYNSSSKLTQRTDARGVVTTYSYDTTLNRLTQISYTTTGTTAAATPSVSYTYGTNQAAFNNGRLFTVADGAGSESYTYDRLGRTTQVQKTMHGVNYTAGYSFNLANQVTSLTYPSGRVVNQNRDAIGRMASIQNNADQSNYVSSIAYNASNQVTGFNYGNGVTGSFGYSADRRQLTSLSYANGPTSLFSLGYGYAQNGANDGEITSITDSVDNGRSETYGYDSLNRLTAAQTTGSTNYPQWGLSETYDRYGNRTAQSVTAGTGPSNSVVIDPNTNRITDTGYSYDSSGNMTADGLNSLTYDAESRAVTSVSGGNTTNYTYTGSGMRVQKSAGGSSTQYIFASGKPIAEYNGSTLLTEYVYFGNQLVATLNSSGAPTYQHRDHLSIRLRTDSSGNVLAYQGHYPFGETWHNTGSPHQWMFTSYERDSESGNDYAIHRFDASRLGRFTTADPVRGRIRNPQRLNRYAYVVSDPVNRLDPQGLDDFLYQGDWGWPADRIGDFWGGGGGGWGVDSLGGWGIDGLGGWDFDGFGGVPNCPDCLRKGRDSFFQCLTYAGGAVGGAFLTCLGACLFVPGYVECAMACAEGADWAIQAVISVCATTGAASYLDCRWRRPANCP